MKNDKNIFSLCLAQLLRPVVRFCLRRSIKLQRFVEVAKAVFIEVGVEELEKSNLAPSVSRLSVMTGVHRKDVDRLRMGTTDESKGDDVLTRIIGHWQNSSEFSDRRGRPKVLHLSGAEGSFVELVHAVSKELNPYTILFELTRLQLVAREEDSIRLTGSEYAPASDPREGFRLLALDTEDLLRAAEENVFHVPVPPHLHLTTRYDNICPEFLPALRKWFMKEGEKFHFRARNYLSQFDKDFNVKLRNKPGGGIVAVGSFSFTEGEPAAVEDAEPASTKLRKKQ